MGSIVQKQHADGVVAVRAEGTLLAEDIVKWRAELEKFVKTSEKIGACGVLIDISDVEELSIEAIDAILEFLADPEEIISSLRTRFALIGVKPFTQRFLREAMPLEDVKHIRARFFHEVAEDEALAWLQALVDSATDLPGIKPAEKPATSGRDKPITQDAKAAIEMLMKVAGKAEETARANAAEHKREVPADKKPPSTVETAARSDKK